MDASVTPLENKVALVTAGATGIGFACARAIVDAGGKVMICARREDTLQEAAECLGPNAGWVACDVTDPDQVDAAVRGTAKRFGKLDLAVNSAGTGTGAPLLETADEPFDMVMKTNLYGVFYCMRAEARVMKEAGGGSIVNIGSIAGTLTHPWMAPYCTSKAAVNMLSRCAADELGEHNIRVNVVQPGIVTTPMAGILSEHELSRREYLSLMPISRIGCPEDVAALVVFLLSDAAGWITGQVISCDGGHTVRKGPNLVPRFKDLLGIP